jgi:hypothetical protein
MMAMTMRVFLSHAWIADSPARVAENPRRGLVRLLRDALLAEELDVFYDADELQELDDIELRIRERLGGSTLLVCWYSDVYRLRRGCDWELMAGLTSDPERVVAVNPERGVEHILPASLRGFILPTAPEASDAAGWARLARRIAEKARATAGVFGDRVGSDATAWHGDPPARFSHFVGRANPLWALDSLLRPASAGSGGAPVPKAVVVHDQPPGVATADFRRWLAPGANARTVVTSRGATYRLVPNLALDVMSSGEAVELLHAGGGEADQDTSEQLAARLGYLPLALEVVGALAAVPGASAATLLAELEDPLNARVGPDRGVLCTRCRPGPFSHALRLNGTSPPADVPELRHQ